ncbi:hypothetical protein J4H86_23615 [Spiractinospora alimapuensis]|uniref:hypothetical protein n=1 Tax=Spiractinospora alimapuensis TaxID=2820884 RepID=UPI001F163992|nr:hypothetical protein [Spiractinospora alimapuensis]QVQ51724.1 hypothetical protein J4H86_23615 [Spiractinospora alimapuensis]
MGFSLLSSVIVTPGLPAAPAWSDGSVTLPEVVPLTQWADFDDVPSPNVTGVAARDTGVVVVADSNSSLVFEVDAAGSKSVLAGTGEPGTPEDGERAAETPIDQPQDVASATSDRTFVSDEAGAIHRIDQGEIETLVPGGELAPAGDELTLAANEDTLFVGSTSGEIHEIDPDSADIDSVTAALPGPVTGLDVGPDGVLYAATGDAVVTVEDGSASRTLYPSSGWELGVPYEEKDTVARDVAVDEQGTVYAVGDSGLVAVPQNGPPVVHPTVTGDTVAHGLGGGLVVSDDTGSAWQLRENVATDPIRLAAPGRLEVNDNGHGAGTVLSIREDTSLASVTAMTVTETGALSPLGSRGTVEFTGSDGGSLLWDERDAVSVPDGDEVPSIVAGRDSYRYVLNDGTLYRIDQHGTPRSLAIGMTFSALEEGAGPPRLLHLAGNGDDTYFASQREVYTLSEDGMLMPFTTHALAGPDERIIALATGPDSDMVYATVDTGSAYIVVRVAASGRPSTMFDTDDVPGTFTPTGLAVGPREILYVTDSGSGRVLRHAGSGSPEVIAGGGSDAASYPSPGLETELVAPTAPAVDSAGTLVFVDDGAALAVTAAHDAPTSGGYPLGGMSVALAITLGVAAAVLIGLRRAISSAE